jgi:hypothetical protein
MPTYLFRFGYAEPAAIAYVEQHPDADLVESSEAVFVGAPSEAEALRLGGAVADAFVRRAFGEDAYDWRADLYASWIELDAEEIEQARAYGAPVVASEADVPRAASQMAARRAARLA